MLEDLIKERLKKLDNFKQANHTAYVEKSRRTSLAADVELDEKNVFVVGRVLGLRVQGGVFFADLFDQSGKIQLVIKKDNNPEFELFKNNLDIGDFVEAGGDIFKTQRGEISVDVKSIKLLSKS